MGLLKMFKTFIGATFMAAVSSNYSGTRFPFEYVDFEAIPQNFLSNYSLTGRYGPYNEAQMGNYAYIYTEVGGDEIPNRSVVSTWATILRPIEFTSTTDPVTGETITSQLDTGLSYVQTETAECVVRYERNSPSERRPYGSGLSPSNQAGLNSVEDVG